MEAILNLAEIGFVAALGVVAAVLIIRSDGNKCEPGPNCKTCPFPCEHNQ